MIYRVALICAALTASVASAQQTDAGAWLGKIVNATQKLSYSGTFVYQHDGLSETSRITHFLDAGQEVEFLEVLDGSPREVIRQGDEVKCYLPESRTVIIERRKQRRSFPALLPTSLTGLTEFYQIRKGPTARIAGLETQAVVLEPRDSLRYGYQFWIDSQSGLLIKAILTGENNESLESFAFTELKLGPPPERERLKIRQRINSDWKVQNVAAKESRVEDSNWQFKVLLPGFRKIAGMRRQVLADGPESLHFVFSDGLAAISVFIEPLSGRNKVEGGTASMGAINVYKRIVGENQIVVMGEVPPTSVRKLGDGIELRKAK